MAILDLHLHSCYSDDGELTPRELMELCQQNGVATAALADHNTAKGVGEAMDWAEKLGVVLIPAIELDCSVEGVTLHVLGYWINPDDPAFEQVYQSILTQEKSASAIRMEKVKALGIRFSDDEVLRLSKNGTVTGEMIAEAAMANNENNDNPLMAPYFPGGARSDNPYVNFYWDFCAQGKAAYAPVQYMSLKQAVGIIRGAGGIPVLAHPGNNIAENESLLETIVSHGVCGL